MRYALADLQNWQKYYNWHDGMTSGWNLNYKNQNRGYEAWSGTQPDYWGSAETNAEFQTSGVFNDLGQGNGRGFMCRSWCKLRSMHADRGGCKSRIAGAAGCCCPKQHCRSPGIVVPPLSQLVPSPASSSLASSTMAALAADPTASTWAFPDPGLGGCAINTSLILTVNNRAAYRLVKQAMTFNAAREYCKTGTNAWNGTLVAWRDYETQLAVEQYFFVGGADAVLCSVHAGWWAGWWRCPIQRQAKPDLR